MNYSRGNCRKLFTFVLLNGDFRDYQGEPLTEIIGCVSDHETLSDLFTK